MSPRRIALLSLACLPVAACQPPAADDYVTRTRLAPKTEAPSKPIASPDTEGALWAPARQGTRILYGKPGERPLMALACERHGAGPVVVFTRFARADEGAKGILALIGNGHVERLFVDATSANGATIWAGSVDARDPRLEVLTGGRKVEATIPGAGSVILNPSAMPGELIALCRAGAPPLPLPGEAVPPTPPAAPA